MKKSLLIVFSILIGFSSAFALGTRPAKPGPGPVPKAAFPPFSEFTLHCGAKVVIVEDHKQPLVYFRSLIMCGTDVDGKNIGTAAAIAYLLEKGTKTRKADDIAQKLDFYGADFGAGATPDNINIFINCLKKDMGSVIPIYADMIRNPSFPKDEFDKYVSQTQSTIKAAKKQSSDPGRKLGRRLVYGEHPYGAFETEESISALTLDALAKYHSSNFCGKNMIVAVVGDVDPKEIIPMLDKQFGDWKAGERSKPFFPPLDETKGMNFSIIDRPSSVQSSIRMQRLAINFADPDYDKASFIDAIFSGNGIIGFQNRLFQNIREKHGYTYTPGGALTKSLDRGVVVAVAEVRNAVTDSALDQMLLEYRRLSSENIPDSELTFAKGLVTGKYLMDLADPQQTSAKALDIIQYGLPKDYYSTYPTRVSKFTAAELRTTAQRVFPPNDLHVIVTGTAAQIMPKLERFGKFKTYDLDLKPIAKVETALKPASLTLDQVLEKMYAAINKPAMEQLKSVEKTSNVTITEQTMKMTGKETEIISVPNLRYEKIELQSLPVIERKNDGSQIYEYQANQLTRGLQGSELTDELSFNMFKKELMLKNPDMNTKLLGISEMKDGDCYVLEVAKEGTSKEKWYISDKTGLVVRREQESPDNPVTYEYSDFRKVGDIPFAYKLTISGAMSMSMDYTDIKLNTNPDPKLFKTK